jgi:outer membrane lipoprotein-sorting protein
MKRFLCLVIIACSASLSAQSGDQKALLNRVDELVRFRSSDFTADYLIVMDKPGQTQNATQAVIFRRDSEEKYCILILKPDVDKGKGYLKIDGNLWFYDPVGRRFTFTSAKERFQNSNARNSDFTRSNFAGDYDVTASSREKLGKFNCTVLSLKANNPEVTFPKTKLWISEDNLVRKTEDYSLSGQLLRTTAIPTYQSIGDRYIPVSVVIVDNLRGKTVNGRFVSERTQITISKPSMEKLPDNLFTKAYLEKVGR